MPAPRKLLTISHSYVVALNRRLAHELSRVDGRSWEATAIAPTYFHGEKDLRPVAFEGMANESIDVYAVPTHFTRSVHAFVYGSALADIIRRGDWSLIHCWEEPFVLAGAQIASLAPPQTPLVFATFQNLPKNYPVPFRQLERYAMNRADGWIAFGNTIERALKSRPMYSMKPTRTISPGVDLDVFRDDLDRDAMRQQLGWDASDRRPVIGFLGRFISDKGLPLLMNVLDQLTTPWRAMFVGAGAMEPTLRNWSQRHGDRVRICTGVQHDDVPRYLSAMDCLCAPSQTTPHWREQFGRMLIEAFACGVPVIGSDSGEIPFVIADAGEVLPEADEARWIASLEEILQSSERRADMRARGLDRVRREFAWPVIAQRHLAFFDELLDARATGNRFTPAPIGTTGHRTAAKPPPRRLLTIAHSYAVTLNRRLVREMSRAGGGRWDVTALAPSYFHGSKDLRPVTFQALPEELRGDDYTFAIANTRLSRHVHWFYYDHHLKDVLRDGRRWDFIHAWEEPYIHVGNQIARWAPAGVPLVYRTAQSLAKNYPPPFNWMEQYNMRRAAGWICSGRLVGETLRRNPMYARRPMRLIPLGVDVEVFSPNRAAGEATRRELNWSPAGPPVIGYLGRFVRDKGLSLMMAALDQLKTPWRALFVGAGPMERELSAFATKHQGRVRICTDVRHDDVPRYLNAMDLLAAPSQTTPHWREQFGRMLIEGFAAGVPVIGSDSGEIPFVIDDVGVVCPERDVHAWVNAFSELLENPTRRHELAQRGLTRARERYAWPIIGRAHIEFFNEILESQTAKRTAEIQTTEISTGAR